MWNAPRGESLKFFATFTRGVTQAGSELTTLRDLQRIRGRHWYCYTENEGHRYHVNRCVQIGNPTPPKDWDHRPFPPHSYHHLRALFVSLAQTARSNSPHNPSDDFLRLSSRLPAANPLTNLQTTFCALIKFVHKHISIKERSISDLKGRKKT